MHYIYIYIYTHTHAHKHTHTHTHTHTSSIREQTRHPNLLGTRAFANRPALPTHCKALKRKTLRDLGRYLARPSARSCKVLQGVFQGLVRRGIEVHCVHRGQKGAERRHALLWGLCYNMCNVYSVYMYVCMYVHVCIPMYMHIYTHYTYIYIYIYAHTYIYTHMGFLLLLLVRGGPRLHIHGQCVAVVAYYY